ncbi:Uncharacterized protein OBRU01_21661 [Operophtera brumata]|uniref:cysteine desulfurase n=1 Tax=Operophtera brumata TaxID=104452 RepID=A0A0L7KTE8_OPEBR|nr:Uncharacterized protein OBRU01_21661 [Operophtera brumata]
MQPVQEIGAICKSKKVFFHTDAAQAVGKVPLDVNKMSIDLMSISGHKVYGPKGVGALFIRRRPRVRVEPIQSGGGQERGMRSGTIAEREISYDHAWMETLSQRFLDKIYSKLTHVIRNGDPKQTGSACTSASLEPSYVLRAIGADEDLAHSSISGSACTSASLEPSYMLRAIAADEDLAHSSIRFSTHHSEVALSSGSACTSASLEPSYVLRAIGADEDLAHSSIRYSTHHSDVALSSGSACTSASLEPSFGLGRFTTMEEVDYTAEKTIRHVERLREMSPLWEMVQEGVDIKNIQWSQH